MDFVKMLDASNGPADIFEVVKSMVRYSLKRSRGGLMLGLADLGNQPGGFFGGFHVVASNVIVLNRIPLHRIEETDPDLYNPYVFHVLLHEYLHTLGFLDEVLVRRLAFEISRDNLGSSHTATRIARNPRKYFPNLVYPTVGWKPDRFDMELVEGFDRSSVGYIA